MKRVIYGPFTIVIITITVGYVNVNDRLLSFTIVVSIELGSSSVHSKNIKMLLMEFQILNLLTIYMEELNMDDIMTRKQTTACEEVDKEN
jgi:hypothetical protein